MNDDFTNIPSATCTNCGCPWLLVPTHFDTETYEIDAYGLQGAKCWACDSDVVPPIPIDSRLDNDD